VFGLFLFQSTQIRRPIHPILIGAIRLLLVAGIILMPLWFRGKRISIETD